MLVLYKFPKNIWKKLAKSKGKDKLLKADKFMYRDTVIIKKVLLPMFMQAKLYLSVL